MIEKEFKINEFITLKLEKDNTVIYVSNKRFRHCLILGINIPIEDVKEFDDIESIDETTEFVDYEEQASLKRDIPPETQFWGHCSNLQVWVENDYNTRLLHRNLAFPLLQKLSEEGDIKAINVFRKEIISRIESKYEPVIEYIIEGGYTRFLKEVDIKYLFSLEGINFLELILKCMKTSDYSDYTLFPHINHISQLQFKKMVLPWFESLQIDKKFWIIRHDSLDSLKDSYRTILINQNLMDSLFNALKKESYLRKDTQLTRHAIKTIKTLAKFLPSKNLNDIVEFLQNLDFEDFSDLFREDYSNRGFNEFLTNKQKNIVNNILNAKLIKWLSNSLNKGQYSNERKYAINNLLGVSKILSTDLKNRLKSWLKTLDYKDFFFIINEDVLTFLTKEEINDFLDDPELNLVSNLSKAVQNEEHWYYALDAFKKISEGLPNYVIEKAIEWGKSLEIHNFMILARNDFFSFLNEFQIKEVIRNPDYNLTNRLIELLEKEDSNLALGFLNQFGTFLDDEDKNDIANWIKAQNLEKLTFLIGGNILAFLTQEESDVLLTSIADDLILKLLDNTSQKGWGIRNSAINALKNIGNLIPLLFIKIFQKSYEKTDLIIPVKLLKTYVLNNLEKENNKLILEDQRTHFIEIIFKILANKDKEVKKVAVIGFNLLGEKGLKLILDRLELFSRDKKYGYLYDLFESGYLSYDEDTKFLSDFLNKLDGNIKQKLLQELVSKFMEQWKILKFDTEFIFKSNLFRTLILLIESKNELVNYLNIEIKKLFRKKIPTLTTFLYLEDLLDLSSMELLEQFNTFKIESISDVFAEIFKFRSGFEDYDWMLHKFEKLGDLGLRLFEDLISNEINWEIKENLFYRIKNVRGLEHFTDFLIKLLNSGNYEIIKLLFSSEIGYEISDNDKFTLIQNASGNVLYLFAKAIQENEYLAESYLDFFYENESDINKKLIPFLKEQIILSFKQENFITISFLTQFMLIYSFSNEELIDLIKQTDLGVISSLIIASICPPLASYRFFNIKSTAYVLQHVFANFYESVGEILKNGLFLAVKTGSIEFLDLFIGFTFYGWQDFTYNHFYEYLDDNDYKSLLSTEDSKFKVNLIKILQEEKKDPKTYLSNLYFLNWLQNKVGESKIDEIINSFKEEAPERFNHIFSKLYDDLLGPISAQILKEFVNKYYIPHIEEVVQYVEMSGQKYFIDENKLNLHATSNSTFGYMRKIGKISEIKGLENLKELKELRLDAHKITQIEGLEILVNLEFLSFRNNQITEIKGLNNLINLKTLYLDGNRIKEIKNLDKLINLETLWLGFNSIGEIKGLENLVNLKELRLTANDIIDIKGLNTLKELKSLWLGFNKIREIKNLEVLSNLEFLSLTKNELKKIKGLENLRKLKSLHIKWNKGTNLIPQNLIEKLGGVNDNGEANTPQKFVEYCQKLKESDNSTETMALQKMGVKTDPLRDKYKLITNEKLQKQALDKIREYYSGFQDRARVFARTSYHGNVEYIGVNPSTDKQNKDFNRIGDLKYLINLQILSLQNLVISDFEWFYYMPKLETLRIDNCIIKKDMDLSILTGLTEIVIQNSKIKKINGKEDIFNVDIKNNVKFDES